MSKQVKSLNKSEQVIFEGLEKKSSWIRYLDSLGWSRGDIVRYINQTKLKGQKEIRYQHVRNVLLQPVKNPVETW